MLEYTKRILARMSFDRQLFQKELKKGCEYLQKEERTQLKQWSLRMYGHLYREEIQAVFEGERV